MEAARRPGEAVQTRFRRPGPGRLPAGERYWLWVWSISYSSVRQTRWNRYCRPRRQFLQWLTSSFGEHASAHGNLLCKRFRLSPLRIYTIGGQELKRSIAVFLAG